MTVEECGRRMTHREFLGWVAWLQEQWNKPDKADHYRMQIALEVRSILLAFAKSLRPPQFEDFKIPFVFDEGEQLPQETVEQAAAKSKARWGVRLRGVKRTKATTATIYEEDEASFWDE